MHHTTHRARRALTGGFTLIELLTVIAIIGILAAILIPTVSSVRAKARATQCASKLREWGNAVRLFSNDAKGNIPLMIDLSAGPSPLHFYHGYFPRGQDTSNQTHSVDYWSVCPTITRTVSDESNRRYYNFLSPNGRKVAAQGANTFGTGALPKAVDYYNITDAKSPSKLILMMEQAPGSSSPITASTYNTALSSPTGQLRSILVNTDKTMIRHNGRIYVLYLDGSTRAQSVDDLQIKLGSGTTAANDPRITL